MLQSMGSQRVRQDLATEQEVLWGRNLEWSLMRQELWNFLVFRLIIVILTPVSLPFPCEKPGALMCSCQTLPFFAL